MPEAMPKVISQTLTLKACIDVKNKLGEGVIWDQDGSAVWWTDILGKTLFRMSWPDEQLERWVLPEGVSCFALLSKADPMRKRFPLLVGFVSGIALYDPASGDFMWVAKPEPGVKGNRSNDGRVDPKGRLWLGTMVEQRHLPQQQGVLYKLDGNGCQGMLGALTIPNSLCWSPDGSTMYHGETTTGLIRQFPFDLDSGSLGEPVAFANTQPYGEPDGAIIDADGYMLCALWGGGAVARFAPDGELVALHPLPVSQVTCVALGGPDGSTLFVTTSTQDLTKAEQQNQPLAGNLFVFETPYKAAPAPTLAVQPWEKLNRALP